MNVFIVRPFGKKKIREGVEEIDFDRDTARF